MNKLIFIEEKILQLEEWFVFIVLMCMVIMAFIQVLLRNTINTGIIWSDIAVRMCVLYIAIAGASIATSEKGHINIDLFNRIIPSSYKYFLDLFITIVALVSTVFFFTTSSKYVLAIKESGRTISIIQTPEWWFTLIFPIGLFLISVKYLISIFKLYKNR